MLLIFLAVRGLETFMISYKIEKNSQITHLWKKTKQKEPERINHIAPNAPYFDVFFPIFSNPRDVLT